jgi:hypothetical protein
MLRSRVIASEHVKLTAACLQSSSMATSACALLVLMPSMEDTIAADGRGTHNSQSMLSPDEMVTRRTY